LIFRKICRLCIEFEAAFSDLNPQPVCDWLDEERKARLIGRMDEKLSPTKHIEAFFGSFTRWLFYPQSKSQNYFSDLFHVKNTLKFKK